jgi:hypothetical protein
MIQALTTTHRAPPSIFTQPVLSLKISVVPGDELDLHEGKCCKVKFLILKGLGNQQFQRNPWRDGLLLLETEKQSYD